LTAVGRYSFLILVALAVFVAANWDTIKTAWKYREQIKSAAAVSGSLQTLGVIK
jgi:hypothetical protein